MCKQKEALAYIDSKEHLFGLGKDILADNPALRALHWPEWTLDLKPLSRIPYSTRVASRRAVGVLVQTTRSLAGAAVLAQT